ncbi:MAG: tetratricopeptide repeat protein [Nitrospirae bacterium]|nr:tetratricopeptide repeat protein [Nitrospirota bacterium]MCL5423040.1 tetratricopeptide repeat protein [Nitrospirota bacterium]
MGKFALLLFVLLLLALGYFAVLNEETITLTVAPKTAYEMPKIALILLSFAVGAAVMLVYFFFRDTKRFIDSRQHQRKQKRDMHIQELYSRALNAILADNEDEARSALESILQEEPGHMDALLRLGDIAAGDEDYQKALSYYKRARDIQPQNIEVLFSLERMMGKTGRGSEANLYLDEILRLDPDNLTALYRKRSLLEKSERWDDIIAIQRTIIKCEHNEKDRQREQKNLLGYKYEQGRYSIENAALEKAKKAFTTVLRLDKDFVPAYLGLAEAMLREGESEDAVALLQRGFEQTSSNIILARMEDLLINLGEPGRLITLYRNSTLKEPQNQALRFFMGKLFYRLEMLDDAYDTLATVDASSAPYPELHQLLGNIYLRRQQCEKAVEEFKKVIAIKKPFRLPYCCYNCGYSSDDWSGRCPNCKEWDTYQFNLYGVCKA